MTTIPFLDRAAGLAAIDAIRNDQDPATYDALSGVVRDLHDGYPLSEAHSSLSAASWTISPGVTREVRAILDRIGQ